MDEPAHEEEDKRNDAEDADNHGDSDEDGRGSKCGGENCTEIIQAAAADLGPVLAEMKYKDFLKNLLRDLANNLLTIRCRIMQISLQDGSLVL